MPNPIKAPRISKELINKKLNSGKHTIKYNAQHLQNGLYFVQLVNNKSKYSRTVIKQN